MAKGDRFNKRVVAAGLIDETVLSAPLVDIATLFPAGRPNVQDVDLDDYRPKHPNKRDDLKCGECGAVMVLRESSKFPTPFYGCSRFPECKGTHGARKDGAPHGTPADKETRKARIRAHYAFDQIWKSNLVKHRGAAYDWMRRVMGLRKADAHIGQFTTEQCSQLVDLVYRDYPGLKGQFERLIYDDDPFDD